MTTLIQKLHNNLEQMCLLTKSLQKIMDNQ